MRYLIDWLGQLWKGPVDCQNLHWARFHGYMTVAPYEPIWVAERTDPPEDADEVSEEQAKVAMQRFDPLLNPDA
jgi:hypothetical protein